MKKYAGLPDWLTCISLSILVTASNMEVSVLTFVDGNTYRVMTSAQDHKRAKDGDQGLNTGGMGTFSPSPFYTDDVDLSLIHI